VKTRTIHEMYVNLIFDIIIYLRVCIGIQILGNLNGNSKSKLPDTCFLIISSEQMTSHLLKCNE
jgi:hypothetical protein